MVEKILNETFNEQWKDCNSVFYISPEILGRLNEVAKTYPPKSNISLHDFILAHLIFLRKEVN